MSTTQLSEYTSCEVSDALIKLGVPTGGHIPDIFQINEGPRICAPAYTVRMVYASDEDSPKLSAHFVDTAPAGSIIVIDAPISSAGAKNAVWGGLMSAGAKARSAIGVIISGRCRDVSEHRNLGFPVFARGQSTLGQGSFVRPSQINVPLVITPHDHCGAIENGFLPTLVAPGDWIIADEDGVVCVPKGLETEVIALAKKGREVDELCMRDIQAGKGIQASFKLHRGK